VRITVATFVLISIGACAGGTDTIPFAEEKEFWPDLPETRRIAFVGEFSSSAELGIRESAWSRIVSFTAGSEDDAMVRPMAVVASDDGKLIFVADPDARCVHRYDLRRGRYRCLAISRRESLISPVGLAIGDDGQLFVADSRLRRIYHAAADDKWLQPLELGSDLQQPTGIAWNNEQRLLFVTDTGSQSIKAFDANGTLVEEFGNRGGMPGEFNFPTYLWVDRNAELLVTDSLNFRIQRFGKTGEFLHTFGQNGDRAGNLPRPKGVATDRFGHVYVVDALFNALQIFDGQGKLLLSIGGRGQGAGEFWLPNGVFVGRDNTIYVADSYNQRVQVFRYIGPEA
jgi:sugar lactone lactonase YvrE